MVSPDGFGPQLYMIDVLGKMYSYFKTSRHQRDGSPIVYTATNRR